MFQRPPDGYRGGVLGELLGGRTTAHAALSYLVEPWGLRFATDAALTVHVVLRGSARLGRTLLASGDVVLVRQVHDLTDPTGTSPGAVVDGPGRTRETHEGPASAADRWRLGRPRSYGVGLDAPTVVAHAVHLPAGVLGRRSLAALPDVLHTPAHLMPAALRELLLAEAARGGPGQQDVLDRIVELVVLTSLRANPQVGPVAARADPVVGPVLELLHAEPATSWTVSELAARVGVSRAALARRFTGLLGEGVIAHLTAHRLDLAADLVRTSDRTLASIAQEVGYGDGFSLSAAYRRRFGRAPSRDRASADRGSSTAR